MQPALLQHGPPCVPRGQLGLSAKLGGPASTSSHRSGCEAVTGCPTGRRVVRPCPWVRQTPSGCIFLQLQKGHCFETLTGLPLPTWGRACGFVLVWEPKPTVRTDSRVVLAASGAGLTGEGCGARPSVPPCRPRTDRCWERVGSWVGVALTAGAPLSWWRWVQIRQP